MTFITTIIHFRLGVLALISFVRGEVDSVGDGFAVIDTGGIGYKLNITNRTAATLVIGEVVKLQTYMYIKEDALALFGFENGDELEMFTMLLGVTGIGPKLALALLGFATPSQLIMQIVTEDTDGLAKAQGVGKRTAQRIVMELKDKLKKRDLAALTAIKPQITLDNPSAGKKQDALDALIALGYKKAEAADVLAELPFDGLNTEDYIKLALKKIISKR